MTIKEFSHKHSLVFFWATVVLAALALFTYIASIHRGYGPRMMMRGDYRGHKGDMMMRGGQRQMMDYNNPNQPMINDTPGAAGTVEAGADIDPNVPVEVQ